MNNRRPKDIPSDYDAFKRQVAAFLKNENLFDHTSALKVQFMDRIKIAERILHYLGQLTKEEYLAQKTDCDIIFENLCKYFILNLEKNEKILADSNELIDFVIKDINKERKKTHTPTLKPYNDTPVESDDEEILQPEFHSIGDLLDVLDEENIQLIITTRNLPESTIETSTLHGFKKAIEALPPQRNDIKTALSAVYTSAHAEEESAPLPTAVNRIILDFTRVAENMCAGEQQNPNLLTDLTRNYERIERSRIHPKLRAVIATAVGVILGAALGFCCGLLMGGITSIPMMFVGAALLPTLLGTGTASLLCAGMFGLPVYHHAVAKKEMCEASKHYGVHMILKQF